MAGLIRHDPLRDIYSMSRAFDRFLDRSLDEIGSEWDETMNLSLPLDVIENKDAFEVKASVSGFDPKKLEVTFTNGTLTIKGEINDESDEKEEGKYHIRERRIGSFCRSISVPSAINADKIEAETENGVLTLRLPKREEVKPKRIEVKSKNVKVIEGKSK